MEARRQESGERRLGVPWCTVRETRGASMTRSGLSKCLTVPRTLEDTAAPDRAAGQAGTGARVLVVCLFVEGVLNQKITHTGHYSTNQCLLILALIHKKKYISFVIGCFCCGCLCHGCLCCGHLRCCRLYRGCLCHQGGLCRCGRCCSRLAEQWTSVTGKAR